VFEAADGEEITGLTLSADGEKLAACVRNPEQTGRICVWSGDTFEVQLTLENDHGFISDLLISPNGTRLAASFGKYNEAGKVVIWELNDAKKELQLPGRLGHVWRMAFTSDGERLITAGGEIDRAELFEWDLAAGRQVRSLQGHKHAVTHLAASQDGLCLLICDIGTSILWDLSTGSKLRIWKGHSGSVKAVNFSPDGKRLLTAGGRHDGELFLWDVPDGELAAEYAGAAMPYSHAAFSHDGSRIVAGAGQKRGPDITLKDGSATRTRSSYLGDTIFVWDVQSRRLSKSWKRDDDQALCFNRAGDKIVTRKGCLIDAETGALAVSPTRHDTFIQQPAISSDGRWIVTPDQRGQVILWDANVGRSVRSFGEHTGKSTDQWVYGVAISPDNRRVATASRNGTAVIWALATGARLATLRGHKGEVTAVAFSPDGKRLATGGFDSQIILWDADTGRRLGNLPGGTWNVRSLAFSPSSRRLISAHGNNIGYIIDVASRKQLVSLPGNKKRMGCVAYSPDGKWVYTGGDGGAGILWDAQALRGVHTLSPEGFAWSAVFSRDSRTLFVGGNELVRAFDVATGREKTRISFTGSVHGIAAATSADRFIAADNDDVTVFEQSTMRRVTAMRSIGSDGWLSASCLSADGDRVLYGNSNGRLMLCETETGNDIQSFHGHAALVNGMAFMPDGRRVVSASSDGSSAVWDASTGDMLLRMIVLDDGREWLAVTPEGLFDGSPGGRASVKVRATGGLDLEPIDRFFQDFYHPGLLAEIAHGERPMPQGDFASRMAPLVKIMSPRQGSAIVDARVTIEAEVTDRGGGIKGPWIVQNGARVLAEGERTVTGGRVRQTFVLSLVEGENRLEVRAASGDGSWESEPASLLLNYEQPLAEPAVYLVAVGINKYAEESLNLRFAAPDARDLAGVFQARGPSLYGAERTHVTPLVDEQATQQGIREALGQLAKVANPQDTVVVFLAGHGATIGQRYYFITQEFKQEEEHFEDDVRKQGFAADEFGDLLGKTRALKRVLIFDTCQSGGALAVHQTARDPFAFRGALERLSHSQGVFTIAAAAANDQAQEAQQLKHGLLTYALLAGLGAVDEGPLAGQQLKPAGDANVAEVREWFSFAQDKVPLLTKLYFGQEQFVGFSGQGASFPVLPLKDKSESVR
ncbi:MAG TPA: caspase family protein, partial [Pirellulales bacterium]|nr:caspase family protein [Pirellulales bacterium]